MQESDWTARPARLRAPEKSQVHVWRIMLSDTATDWEELLSAEERQRADRFVFEQDRHTYRTTRSVLRLLLGQYLDTAPASLNFVYNRFGKPELAESPRRPRLRFNVAHSHGFAVLAFGETADLGIDVEHHRCEDLEGIAQSVLAPSEYDWVLAAPPSARLTAFLRLWTHKEAIVKALGYGLSIPLTGIEIATPPPTTVHLRHAPAEIGDPESWFLVDLPVHSEYSAALAVRPRPIDLQLLDWK